tara:strand:- start:8 stop:256 length:249 start_codon:yes stop_codon:yes gene_type:complete
MIETKNRGGEMRTKEEVVKDIENLHNLERNVNNVVPTAYSGKFADAPSVWHTNTRLATELALIEEPHILFNANEAKQYLSKL